MWLHNLADLGIWAAYMAIPLLLIYFIRRRTDIPFGKIFWMFGSFIVLCGMTHLLEIGMSFSPMYRLSGLVKLITALVSLLTAAALVPLIPRALAMRSPKELEEVNRRLGEEAAARQLAQRALEAMNKDLERRVAERGAALEKVQEQLVQSLKMDAVGRLAGGVAHDFNNLLAVISGYGHLAQEKTVEGSELHRHLNEVLNAGDRAATLVRQLLAFSRKQLLRPKVVSLNGIVSGMESMLRPLLGDDVRLVLSLLPGLPAVRVDPHQMEQVVMNLAANARDAMPRGGELRLETSKETLASGETYAVLSVADSGTGMDRETLSKIFEPFFTTKGPDKGTGLGLSSIHGIVEQSGGYIKVSSEPGAGSTFRIHLPAHAVHDAPATPPESRPAPAVAPRSETILLVEDNGAVRELADSILRSAGFTVLSAPGGEEALKVVRAHSGPIHLLLSDIVMPEMSGPELAAKLLKIRPDLRVVFMSGYSEEVIRQQARLGPYTRLITKPFTPSGLLEEIHKALDESRV